MDTQQLFNRHLYQLQKLGARPAGSSRNREAGSYIESILKHNGYSIESQEFPSSYWSHQIPELSIDGTYLTAVINSYSPNCSLELPFNTIATIKELEASNLKDKIAVLYGELTMEPISPKNNKFFNPDHHKKIISLLENKKPSAIITISHELSKPSPILEDADFNIPSATVSAEDGLKILMHPDGVIKLVLPTYITNSSADNIIGRRISGSDKKLVISANFDTRYNSIGAFDNASGTAALLVLSEILASEALPFDIELVAFNDEEYTSKGAILYLEKYRNSFSQIAFAINLDAIGNRLGVNCIATFETDAQVDSELDSLLQNYTDIIKTEPWYSEDHTIFLLNNVPTIAFSSIYSPYIINTRHDTIEWVDPKKASSVISFITDFIKDTANQKNAAVPAHLAHH